MKLTLLFSLILLLSTLAKAQWQTTNCPSSSGIGVAADGNNVYVATAGSGVYISNDLGSNWNQSVTSLSDPYVWNLSVDGSRLYAATMQGVNISTDGGFNWTYLSNGPSDITHAIITDGPKIFAGTNSGIWYSPDYGNSWAAVNNGLTFSATVSFGISGTNVFAGTSGGGVFLSTNNGADWIAINNGLTAGNIRTIAIDGSYIYVGTSLGGVFLSIDNGSNWVQVNNGMFNHLVNSLAVSNGNVFAGTAGGVFVSNDHGNTWLAVNDGFTDANISSLSISGNYMYAGTFLSNTWRRSLSEMVGIDAISGSQPIMIYPNPVSSEVTIELPVKLENSSLVIYDGLGRIVRSAELSQQLTTINIHDLPFGIYDCQIKKGEYIFSQELMVFK